MITKNPFKNQIKFLVKLVKAAFNWKILILAFVIYACIIISIIYKNLDDNAGFWSKLLYPKSSNKRIVFYTSNNRIGEYLTYLRNRKVATKLGIENIGFKANDDEMKNPIRRHLYFMAASIINVIFKPDLKITVTHLIPFVPAGPGKNIVYITLSGEELFNNQNKFYKDYQHLRKYDIYADLYSFVHGTNPNLETMLIAEKLEGKKIIPMYNVAFPYDEYHPVEFKQAVITGSLWGCNRSSLRISRALKKLGDEGLLVSYGIKNEFKFMEGSFKGFISFENSYDGILQVQRKHGIGLVIHTLNHMLEGLPTNRIAEVITAGAIAISDEHSFVRKYFGDNVLYINTLTSSEEIYQQVKDHIEHIRQHPTLYHAKAKAAHKIYMEQLTLEKQLENLYNQAMAE